MINSNQLVAIFRKLQEDPANRVCFECSAPGPSWASLPNSIFICYECSGVHRGMGVHLSFVRSTTIDAWQDRQVQMMLFGGNRALREHFERYGIPINGSDMAQKYRTKAGTFYRERMRCLVDQIQEPPSPSIEEGSLEDIPKQIQIPKTIPDQLVNNYRPPPPQEDTLDKMKQSLVNVYQKTALMTKQVKEKVDKKIQDAQFQQNIQEIRNQSQQTVHKGVEKIKHAWNALSKKIHEVSNKPVPTQSDNNYQPNQVEQKEPQKPQQIQFNAVPQQNLIDFFSDEYNNQVQNYSANQQQDNSEELYRYAQQQKQITQNIQLNDLMDFDSNEQVEQQQIQNNLMDFEDYPHSQQNHNEYFNNHQRPYDSTNDAYEAYQQAQQPQPINKPYQQNNDLMDFFSDQQINQSNQQQNYQMNLIDL